jgi:DNA helicase-2/ATP-dependent DNA helicase PcrA
MSNQILQIVMDKIRNRHQGDEKQLEVIFSTADKILVEAPAGYGKTNTMVSKIAYMLATQQIPNPKKILALTFSVNAAYKIKKDVNQQIPDLLKGTGLNIDIKNKIFVSNYHGFCRSILKKYGYKFHELMLNIDKLQSVDDSKEEELMNLGLSESHAKLMSDYNNTLKKYDKKLLLENLNEYNDVVINELLPNRIIPYNAILTLTIKLFNDYPQIVEFYQKYFVAMIVDEYQDTNYFSYQLICNLITDKTKIIFLGDSLQRIYGFIGAVPNLISITTQSYNPSKISLGKNYRFASNSSMLQLDSNIRKNAENPLAPKITEQANVDVSIFSDQKTEALEIAKKALSLTDNNSLSKVAILVRQRGNNTNCIISALKNHRIPYFYALFTDEDSKYIEFHKKCLYEFIELIQEKDIVTKKLSISHINKIKESYNGKIEELIKALINLLEILWNKVFSDFSFLSNEEKIILIKDTFEHNSLKQYIEFVNASVIISTVHAAKGLEWDFVILPDMEQDLFPGYRGLCEKCQCKTDCNLEVTNNNNQKFLEELSIFYVAITRAKKQVYFTASKTQLDQYGHSRNKNISCFLRLPGIEWNDADNV